MQMLLQRKFQQSNITQNFAGAGGRSAVNFLMIKRALVIAIGFLGFCFSLPAEQTKRVERSKAETTPLRQLRPSALDTPARLTLSRPEFFNAMPGSVLTENLLMLTLFDGQRLPASSESGWTGMAPLEYFEDELPSAAEVERANAAPAAGKDLPSEMVNSPLSPIYYGGEIGVFYGRSSGKFDREIMQTYFLGAVGNEKFQITVGAAYQESNGSIPRCHSFTGPK
jgi:hypothetical protein